MIATTMLRRFAEMLSRRLRWLALGASVTLAPKCLLCVAAYAGLGAALGLGGRELCGAPAGAAADPLTIIRSRDRIQNPNLRSSEYFPAPARNSSRKPKP